MNKKLPIVLLLVALLAPAASADEAAASTPVVAAGSCPAAEEHSRERPSRECVAESVLTENTLDNPDEYRRHILHEAQALELQVLGYGLLIGLAGKLAGRSFWVWGGIGVLFRLGMAALSLLPY